MKRHFPIALVALLPWSLLGAVSANLPPVAQPWPMPHVCRDFLIANSLNAADVDGDGALDLVVGGRRHSITKQYAGIRWLRAPTDRKARRDLSKWATYFLDPDTPSGHGFVFADLNGDGRLDLVGALIHNDGILPKDKASVFWLENNVGPPDTWRMHPIKWSDGANTRDPWIGEKWDHLIPLDVDGDGDLDLLGNVEEHFRLGPDGKDISWFSVVWFENPLK